MARNTAASSGLASTFVTSFCSTTPTMPTGIVPRMIIQASRWSGVAIRRCPMEEKNPRTIRSQSRQKNAIIATAVATCSPTMNARYGEPVAETFSVFAQLPPISAGNSTLCPRLETGNSSVTPWTSPVTTAWRYVRWYDTGRASLSVVSGCNKAHIGADHGRRWQHCCSPRSLLLTSDQTSRTASQLVAEWLTRT